MKDQDLGYIRMQKQKEIKIVDRLQSSLHFLDQTTTASKKRETHNFRRQLRRSRRI